MEQPPSNFGIGAHNITILRRRDRDVDGGVSKAIDWVKNQANDLIDKAHGKTLHLLAFALRERIDKDAGGPIYGSVGIRQAFSVVLTHVLAPLWALTLPKGYGSCPPLHLMDSKFKEFARMMDLYGIDIEVHHEILLSDREFCTTYIIILLAKLLTVEAADYLLPSYQELLCQVHDETRLKGEYEEQLNDETVAFDGAKRRLTEVGGSWHSPGAVELPFAAHEVRQNVLINIMAASVMYKYYYTEEHLQYLCDAVASRLGLLKHNENIIQIVAGIKGPQYLSKYLLFRATPFLPSFIGDCQQPAPQVNSVMLVWVKCYINLALQNFVHRNDTSDFLLSAMMRGLALCPKESLAAFLTLSSQYLSQVYCVDIQSLATFMDQIRKYCLFNEPIGSTAMRLMLQISDAMRNAGMLQRQMMSSAYVGGREARSFRLQPAHVITTPYCARASVFVNSFYLAPLGLQRHPDGQLMVPTCYLPLGSHATSSQQKSKQEPLSDKEGNYLDDSTLYIANLCINVFQALVELSDSSNTAIEKINLAKLFSIPPHILCPYYPLLHQLLNHHLSLSTNTDATTLSVPTRTSPRLVEHILNIYNSIVDQCSEEPDQRKYRFESPLVPTLPTFVNVCTDIDDMNETLKHINERHFRYCSARVTDREVGASFLHPQREQSLSEFVENDIRLVVAGGNGLFRQILSSMLQLQNTHSGTLLKPKFYILPFGYDNDIAEWLARRDSLYYSDVLMPILACPIMSIDTPTPEAMLSTGLPPAVHNQDDAIEEKYTNKGKTPAEVDAAAFMKRGAPTDLRSLTMRSILNNYLLHAKQENRIIVYQAECVSRYDPSITVIIPFCGCIEVGTHINSAMLVDGSLADVENKGLEEGGELGVASHYIKGHTNSLVGAIGKPFYSSSKNVDAPGCRALPPLSRKSFVQFGDTFESVERVLVRLYGTRGPRLGTHRHLTDTRRPDIRESCEGVDIIDWVSMTYHMFDVSQAERSTQTLIDLGVFIPECVPHNADPSRFNGQALYTIRPREPTNDEQPLAVACSRSSLVEIARQLHSEFYSALCLREGFFVSTNDRGPDIPAVGMDTPTDASGDEQSYAAPGCDVAPISTVPIMRCRVSFTGRRGDLRYVGLDEQMAIDGVESTGKGNTIIEQESCGTMFSPGGLGTHPDAPYYSSLVREVISLKVRATGQGGDYGTQTNPTEPTLHMTLMQPSKRRNQPQISLASSGATAAVAGASVNDGQQLGGGVSRDGLGLASDPIDVLESYSLTFGDGQSKIVAATSGAVPLEQTPAPPSSSPFSANSQAPVPLVDPNAVLTIEHCYTVQTQQHQIIKANPIAEKASASLPMPTLPKNDNTDTTGLMLLADGDLFGPFSIIRIKPVTLQQPKSQKASAGQNAQVPVATMSVMSFIKA